MSQPVTLIAHRGLPARFPENSLAGICAALEAGAKFVEVDIQFSKDQVPFIYHDENMLRMSNTDQSILQSPAEAIRKLSIYYPPTSPSPEKTETIATLEQLTELIAIWPDRYFFLELKRHSIQQHGVTACVQQILFSIENVSPSCIPISFDARAVEEFQKHSDNRVGWVVREWNNQHHKQADSLAPDFLFCNVKKIPDDRSKLWQGPWQWVLYTVNDIQHLHQLQKEGFSLIETNEFDKLQPRL